MDGIGEVNLSEICPSDSFIYKQPRLNGWGGSMAITDRNVTALTRGPECPIRKAYAVAMREVM